MQPRPLFLVRYALDLRCAAGASPCASAFLGLPASPSGSLSPEDKENLIWLLREGWRTRGAAVFSHRAGGVCRLTLAARVDCAFLEQIYPLVEVPPAASPLLVLGLCESTTILCQLTLGLLLEAGGAEVVLVSGHRETDVTAPQLRVGARFTGGSCLSVSAEGVLASMQRAFIQRLLRGQASSQPGKAF